MTQTLESKRLCFKTYKKQSLTSCNLVVLHGFFPSEGIPSDISDYSTSPYTSLECTPNFDKGFWEISKILTKTTSFQGDSRYGFKIHFGTCHKEDLTIGFCPEGSTHPGSWSLDPNCQLTDGEASSKILRYSACISWLDPKRLGFPCSSVVKNLPANTRDVGSNCGSGRPLEKGMATHCSILAWKIPWMGYSQWGHKQLDMIKHACRASLVAQLVKNLLAIQESPVWFLGWEDPLEKGTATHSSILAWRIPWTI